MNPNLTSTILDERALERAENIIKKLEETGVNESKIDLIRPMIEHAALMEESLEDSAKLVKGSHIVTKYDNGGGQKGFHENPIFKGYESLWKTYKSCMDTILAVIPEGHEAEKQDEEVKAQNLFEVIRSKKNA